MEKQPRRTRRWVSAEVSDMDYLRSRMTKAFAADEEEDEGASEDIQASWQ